MSLRTRVLLGLTFIAVLLVGTALVVTRTTERYLIDQVDGQLVSIPQPRALIGRSLTGGAGTTLVPPPRSDQLSEQPSEQSSERPSPVFVGVIVDGTVRTVFAPDLGVDESSVPAIDIEQAVVAADGAPFTTGARSGSSRFRVRAVRDSSTDLVVVQALPLDATDEVVARLVLAEAIATVVILAVLALVGWWVTRLGVRPVKEMAHTATLIAQGDLSQRVPDPNPRTEAGELGRALNTMLTSIEGAFDERTASEARLRRFVADASHELRTPVATIRGYAELYRSNGLATTEKLDDAMRRTEQEAIRMGALVEAMLELARLDQGRELELRPVDLSAVARDVGNDAAALVPGRSVRIETDGQVMVRGDLHHLHQVAANLVGNALAYSDPDTVVRVGVSTAEGFGILEVSDDGPGMSEEVAARVFERFYRADAARSRRTGGAGLGLSIVDAVVRAHGGSVVVDTKLGAGTTVGVALPLLETNPARLRPDGQVATARVRLAPDADTHPVPGKST